MKNIFNLFKKAGAAAAETSTGETPVLPEKKHAAAVLLPSSPALREAILGFIIQSMEPYTDEKGVLVAGLHFYMHCSNAAEKEAASIALYLDRPGLFRSSQLERKLHNHFIQLDHDWFFDCQLLLNQPLPENSIRKNNFGLKVVRAGEPANRQYYSKARVEVLAGLAEYNEYLLDPLQQSKFYIGRTKTPQLVTGKIQQNDIVFLGSDEPGFSEISGSQNGRVSRNHAYILYDAKTGNWLLYPDNGGLPENGNKVKVHTSNDRVKWLNIPGVSHCLADGDQVELGGAAVLRFRLLEGATDPS